MSLLVEQHMDICDEGVNFCWFESVVKATPKTAITIYKHEVVVMYECFFDARRASAIYSGDQVAVKGHVVEALFRSGEKHPLLRIGVEAVRIRFHCANRIAFRVH